MDFDQIQGKLEEILQNYGLEPSAVPEVAQLMEYIQQQYESCRAEQCREWEVKEQEWKKKREEISQKELHLLKKEQDLREQDNLDRLYEYEQHCLELVRQHKDEIKFISDLQEDLRRERSRFFSQDLKEISSMLKESQVESPVASYWIERLVDSYTSSLDLCSGLVNTHTIDTVGILRQRINKKVNKHATKQGLIRDNEKQ